MPRPAIVDTGAKLTAAGNTQAINGSVRNAIAGTGWTNAAGTGGMANIAANDQGQTLNNYKKVQFPAVVTYDVWVGGVQVTSANMNDVLRGLDGDDATVTYTPATETTPATLTLDGAEITSGSHNYAAIYAEGDLTVNVTADSTVTGPEADYSYGVYSGGSLTVTGTGELTAEGSTAQNLSIGVHTQDGSVTVAEGATLKATCGEADESCGVLAHGAVTVNGTLTATGGTSEFGSAGVYSVGRLTVTVSGALEATGGKATGEDGTSYGVFAYGAVTVNGTLTAEGGAAQHGTSYGVYEDNGAVNVVANGELTAAGGTQAVYGSVKNRRDSKL